MQSASYHHPIENIEDISLNDFALLDESKKLENLRLYSKSIEIVKTLIDKYPFVPHFHNRLAILYEKSLQIELAHKTFLKNLTLFPNDLISHISYGHFLQQKVNPDESLDYYLKLVKKFPHSKHVLLGLSIAYSEKMDLENGIKYANQAITLDPNFHSAYSQKAHCLQELSKTKKNSQLKNVSTSLFEKARKIKPTRIDKHDFNLPKGTVQLIQPPTEFSKKSSQEPFSLETINPLDYYSGNQLINISKCEAFLQLDLFKETLAMVNNLKNSNNPSMLKPFLLKEFDEIKNETQQGHFETATIQLKELRNKLHAFFSTPKILAPTQNHPAQPIENFDEFWDEIVEGREKKTTEDSLQATVEITAEKPNTQADLSQNTTKEQTKNMTLEMKKGTYSTCQFILFGASAAIVLGSVAIASYLNYSK